MTFVSQIHSEQSIAGKLQEFDDQVLSDYVTKQDKYAGKYTPRPAAKPSRPSARKAFNKKASRKKLSSKRQSSKSVRGHKKTPRKSLAKRRSINSKSAFKKAFQKASSNRPRGLAATFNKRSLKKVPPKASSRRHIKPKSSIKNAFNKKARYAKIPPRAKDGKKPPSYLTKKFNEKSNKQHLRTKFKHTAKKKLPTGNKIKFDKSGLHRDMKKRGWSKIEIRELTKTKPTGKSTDRRKNGRDPATVYGTRQRYVVINDRTAQVVQVSGKGKDGKPWKPDRNIKWH